MKVLDPSLRQLLKKTIKKCCGCKSFHVRHYPEPSTGLLSVEHTTQNILFKIIGTDYTGPSLCKTKRGKETKVYILLFTCRVPNTFFVWATYNDSRRAARSRYSMNKKTQTLYQQVRRSSMEKMGKRY